jgi:hypothetical protein
MAMQTEPATPRITIAFPKSETDLRVVFSEPVDPESAESPTNYKTRSGLLITGAKVDRSDPRYVDLTTQPMNGEVMQIDVLYAPGVATRHGARFDQAASPEFIQGLASIPEIQKPAKNAFPFPSRFIGKIATASCGKDGGVDSNVLIDTFGFAFIHMESGGPFNSLKIVTKRHIPDITQATRRLLPGQTVHVLWAGGEIRNVDGETQLVDTGYMEGSIIPPNPLRSPPPFTIKTAELTNERGRSLRASGLQGVIVRFEDATIEEVSAPGRDGQRIISFHDASGESLRAVVLGNVKAHLWAGQKLSALRGLVHQPSAGMYEVIVELDQHLVLGSGELFGHVVLVEGYALPTFHGCHALVALRDTPGETVAVLTTDPGLQSLLQTALQTSALIAFWGRRLANPPTPRGGSWAVDVYETDGIIVYDRA